MNIFLDIYKPKQVIYLKHILELVIYHCTFLYNSQWHNKKLQAERQRLSIYIYPIQIFLSK